MTSPVCKVPGGEWITVIVGYYFGADPTTKQSPMFRIQITAATAKREELEHSHSFPMHDRGWSWTAGCSRASATASSSPCTRVALAGFPSLKSMPPTAALGFTKVPQRVEMDVVA